MGGAAVLPPSVPCAKGWVPYCLDQCSKGRGARARLRNLSQAIASLAPSYHGLEEAFDTHLLSGCVTDPRLRERIVEHLKMNWFDADSPQAYFPHQPVAQIYAQGVLKALELSLTRRRTVPINAWWIVDSQEVRMLTLADVNQGVTVGGQVTLLILTPRPGGDGETSRTPILGDEPEAWVSEQQGNQVTTRRVKDLARAD
jgi:hypothetical protein